MQFDLLADGIAATSARAALGFLAALALFKTAKKRFLRGGTPLDTLLIVIVGAVLGRGVVEGEHFYSALAGCVVLVLMHYLLAGTAFLFPGLSSLIEGQTRVLVREGRIDPRQMRAALLKPDDLLEAARLRGISGLDAVREARQERSGEISLLLYPDEDRLAPIGGRSPETAEAST